MIADILMALVVAVLFEMMSLISKHFKTITIFVSCAVIEFVYFIGRCPIEFIGEIDLAIWILLVITFNVLITAATRLLLNIINKGNHD